MAVADVAVAMGPRNTRRVVRGSIGLVVVAAVVGALALHPFGHGAQGLSPRTSARPASATAPAGHLVFGMTRAQVLAITGQPSSTRGSCLLFEPKVGTLRGLPYRSVGSISMGEPGSIASRSADGFETCFFSGALTTIEEHSSAGPKGPHWMTLP